MLSLFCASNPCLVLQIPVLLQSAVPSLIIPSLKMTFSVEQRIKDALNALIECPGSSISRLLTILHEIEQMLRCTNQASAQPILGALAPLKDALISSNLYKHNDENIKIVTISCIIEIARITAPNPPYNDDQMKDIFEVMVTTLEKLELTGYDRDKNERAISMLRVFAKFKIVLTISPHSWALAKNVIRKCATQLKPYLMQAVQSSGRDLNDYDEIVASICPDESSKMVEQDDKKLYVSTDAKYSKKVKPTVILAIRASLTDEELLGCKIKVWWPKDKKFYEGVVDSFDPIKRKHKKQPKIDLPKRKEASNEKQKVEGESEISGSVAKKAVSKFKRLRKLSDGIEAMNDLASQSHIFQGLEEI
ncbi:Sister chromatid cohesion protein like [Senna tora]|uniref:Sister chromatid cohesion protein like n=1 Tax=Senna tora TaxID=362788 RepID=A0A834W8S7_9FABA|nr:Sister chromatid cohesion protein like [Senna tora]